MAIIKAKTWDENIDRRSLNHRLPLNTPLVLMVDPTNACNLKCSFCYMSDPNIKKIKKFNVLKISEFKKIIDDCEEFDEKIKVLRLYKNGEPLLNKNLHYFIKIAKQSKKIEKIDFTTNGIFFNKNNIQKIIDAGIDKINISINGLSNSDYIKNTSTSINYEHLLENIRYLYKVKNKTIINIKTINTILSDDNEEKFFNDFGEICDEIFIENFQDNWPGFKQNKHDTSKIKKTHHNYVINYEKTVCPFPFYMMVVNSDMTVSLCTQDWKNESIMGSLKTESLKKIWLGENLNKIRSTHLKNGYKCVDICSKCSVIFTGTSDKIIPDTGLINSYSK
jgi:MoaA/NifB/PqqE/SkfB family radical SAM enzyme